MLFVDAGINPDASCPDTHPISSSRGSQHPTQLQNDESSQNKKALIRAAQSIRQRICNTMDYHVVPEAQARVGAMRKTSADSWIFNSEYEGALELEKKLINEYKGENLQSSIPGKVISNEYGACYAISSICASEFKTAEYEVSRRLMISDLKLIPGIGPAREKALKQSGYTTVEKLADHPLWEKSAQDFMRIIDARDVQSIQERLSQRLPKSHPLAHYLAGFCNDGDFAIVDIETMGLSERPIVLLGIAKPGKSTVRVDQYLLRDIQDEPSAVWALVSQLQRGAPLITFNGKSFDIPYIKQRLAYYGMNASLRNPHFDVIHFTRRALRGRLSDFRLETVEKYMGIGRAVDIPGALVPRFYETYLRTMNVGPLVAIVEHNRQDLITLGNLFSRLYEEWDP